jgi:hypothetical protein
LFRPPIVRRHSHKVSNIGDFPAYLVPSFCKFQRTQLAMLGMQEKCDRDDGVRHQKLQTFEPIALSVANDEIHNQD